MGKENINVFTVWIILGKILATFSFDPEAAAGAFGKSDLTLTPTFVLRAFSFWIHSQLLLIQHMHGNRSVNASCSALTGNNPASEFISAGLRFISRAAIQLHVCTETNCCCCLRGFVWRRGRQEKRTIMEKTFVFLVRGTSLSFWCYGIKYI